MPDLAVIIVSWNVRDLLRRCLSTVIGDWELGLGLDQGPRTRNHSTIEIIVVDNASTDGTPEMVRREFPSVHLIASAENRGFAAANNVALNQILTQHVSRITPYIWLLNPDTEVRPGAATRSATSRSTWSKVALMRVRAVPTAHSSPGAVGSPG